MNKTAAGIIAAWALVWGSGCALSDGPPTGSAGASSATGQPAPAGSAGASLRSRGIDPVQIFLSRGTPTDTDADGYSDTIPVIVYLFPQAEASQMPVWTEGEFEFRLIDHDQQLVARWIFPADVAAESRKRLPPGPAYSFFLRLGGDDDRMARTSLELSGVFRSHTGRTVSSQGSAAVQLGSD